MRELGSMVFELAIVFSLCTCYWQNFQTFYCYNIIFKMAPAGSASFPFQKFLRTQDLLWGTCKPDCSHWCGASWYSFLQIFPALGDLLTVTNFARDLLKNQNPAFLMCKWRHIWPWDKVLPHSRLGLSYSQNIWVSLGGSSVNSQ